MDHRRDLGGSEASALGKQGDVNAPFIFAAESRRGAVDHDLALTKAERTFVQQASGEHPGEDAWISRHGAEQNERLQAGRHDAVQCLGDGGLVGGLGGGDARHERLLFCATFYVVTAWCPTLQKM